MIRASLHLPLLLIFLAVPSLLYAQRSGMGGRVSGGVIDVQVRYASGAPGPSGIHVRLESPESGSAGDCQTIEGGKCVFNVPSSGVYMVRMTERGYKDVSVRVELIGNSRGFATLELKPVPGEAPPEAAADVSEGLSGGSVSAADLSVPENARREFEKGQSALKDNKLDSGISHLRKAIKLYDAFPSAYTLLGTAYLEQKSWKDAETALQKATSLDSKSGEAYLALGAVFNQTKDFLKAETALLRGLELKPDAPGGHYELAKTYWALGRWQEAAPHARKAVSDIPDLASPHVLLGNILLKENNPQGALQEYQEYLRLDPNGSMAPGARQMIEKLQKSPHP
jgi:tetratricopeptide (TPR) repeat protein